MFWNASAQMDYMGTPMSGRSCSQRSTGNEGFFRMHCGVGDWLARLRLVIAEHAAPKDEREERVIGSCSNLLIVRLVSVRCLPTQPIHTSVSLRRPRHTSLSRRRVSPGGSGSVWVSAAKRRDIVAGGSRGERSERRSAPGDVPITILPRQRRHGFRRSRGGIVGAGLPGAALGSLCSPSPAPGYDVPPLRGADRHTLPSSLRGATPN